MAEWCRVFLLTAFIASQEAASVYGDRDQTGRALPTASVSASVSSFDLSTPLNVTVQYGGHVYLVCRVQDVGNKSVSWVRKKEGDLLSVDSDTFVGDSRFQVIHPAHSNTWTLHLRGVRGSDDGEYECQVSSEPKMSLLYKLNVVVPQVEIRGAPDVYYMAGSEVVLNCVISGLMEMPPFVFWYRGGQRIAGPALETTDPSSASSSGDVFSGFSRNGRWKARVIKVSADTLLSTLSLPSATSEFSGNYTCGPPSLQLASANLHILHGEHPEAMKDGKNASGPTQANNCWSCTLALLMLVLINSSAQRLSVVGTRPASTWT